MSTDAGRFDLLEHTDVDGFIAYGDPRRQASVAVEGLGPERIVPLCSPAPANSPADTGADLRRLTLIESQLSPVKWIDWFALNELKVRPRPRLSFDCAALAILAAVNGMGVALESTTFAERELDARKLIELSEGIYRTYECAVHHFCYRESDRTASPGEHNIVSEHHRGESEYGCTHN